MVELKDQKIDTEDQMAKLEEIGTLFNLTGNFTFDCEIVHPENVLSNVYFQSAVYTMYAVIVVISMIGNGFVCYIVLSSPRMRTVTNFFIMNLAVGDILITILCVPFTSVSLMKQFWPFGRLLCPLVSYSQALSVFVSAYTLVAISIDKYMVIMWPLKPRISKKYALYIIMLVWFIAGITVWPVGVFATLSQPNNTNYELCDKYICSEDYSQVGKAFGIMYTQILMVLQYAIPSVVLLFTYTSIAAVIWCHRIPGEAENSRDQRIARSKRKTLTHKCPFNVITPVPFAGVKVVERTEPKVFLPGSENEVTVKITPGRHMYALA